MEAVQNLEAQARHYRSMLQLADRHNDDEAAEFYRVRLHQAEAEVAAAKSIIEAMS